MTDEKKCRHCNGTGIEQLHRAMQVYKIQTPTLTLARSRRRVPVDLTVTGVGGSRITPYVQMSIDAATGPRDQRHLARLEILEPWFGIIAGQIRARKEDRQ